MKNNVSTTIGPLVDHKLAQLKNLGAASKQLSKAKRNKRLIRRCHIAMAFIVNEIKPAHDKILEVLPDMKELFEALMKLHEDCIRGHADAYINERTGGPKNYDKSQKK